MIKVGETRTYCSGDNYFYRANSFFDPESKTGTPMATNVAIAVVIGVVVVIRF